MAPRTMCGDVGEAVMTPIRIGCLRGKGRSKPAAPRRILRYACDAVAAVRALRTNIRLRRIGLHKLLPRQSALLTCVPYLFTPLRSLRWRKMPQLTVLSTLQGSLSTQLLRCIEFLLPLRLQICRSLCIRHGSPGLCVRHVRFCLHGRRPLALAFCAQLLPLKVPLLLLNVTLLLLNAAVDRCRCLLSLRRRNVWPRNVRWRRRAGDVRRRHLRPLDLRSGDLWPCNLRRRGARCCNVRCGARCNMWHRRSCCRGRWSCGRRPWRGVRCRTGFSPGILCGSCHRNGDGQRGGQRHPSTQNHHCASSTSAELKFRHSTG